MVHLGTRSRPKSSQFFENTMPLTSTEPKKSDDPKAKPVVSPVFIDKLIEASKYWRVRDVARIVNGWGMKNYFVWYLNDRLNIQEILRKFDDACHSYNVVVSWNSGPRGQKRIKSNLAHWLLDNIMWEVRLKCDDHDALQSRLSELTKIL